MGRTQKKRARPGIDRDEQFREEISKTGTSAVGMRDRRAQGRAPTAPAGFDQKSYPLPGSSRMISSSAAADEPLPIV